MTAPSVEAAFSMGETGGQVVESERAAFEAWMRGHCWSLGATWNGRNYVSAAEQGGLLCPQAIRTRGLWAAWRDRAALAHEEPPSAIPRRCRPEFESKENFLNAAQHERQKMITLGQKGRDKITGFEGILTGMATYLYGCTQYGLVPPAKDGKCGETQWFDEGRIEVVGSGVTEKTFGALLERYADEVSVTKRGAKWELARIMALTCGSARGGEGADPISAVMLRDLDARHFAAWRDRRLRVVAESSVRREWNLLSHACNVGVREWRWLDSNPMAGVRRPANGQARDRRISEDELARLLHCLGYSRDAAPVTKTARVGAVLLLAIETAMRAGELARLAWCDVMFEQSFCRVGRGKTAAARRDVPLSVEALRVLRQLERVRDGPLVCQLTAASIDALFRKARAKALIDDLHFHDSRHEAVTRLSRVFDILSLARVIGHKDLRMLQVYFNPTAEDLARKMRGGESSR